MIGFYTVRYPCTRFQGWIVVWLALFECILRILTLGYLGTNWDWLLLNYFCRKKTRNKDHDWIWNYLQKGPVTKE